MINSLDTPYTVFGTKFYTYELTAGWSFDTPQPGTVRRPRHAPTLSGRYALPFSDVSYYSSSFEFLQYVRCGEVGSVP